MAVQNHIIRIQCYIFFVFYHPESSFFIKLLIGSEDKIKCEIPNADIIVLL